MLSLKSQSSPIRNFVIDTLLSTLIPLAVYHFSRQYLHLSEVTALISATIYPTLKSLADLAHHRQVNPVSILVILGIITSTVALFMGGSAKVLLIRESLLTGVLGVTCLITLVFPRPLMFYFGRYFMAGNDPEKIKSFNQNWAVPKVRRTHRLITTIWGIAFTLEFMMRTWMVLKLSTSTVLAAAPIIFNATILLTFAWTIRYARKIQKSLR
jgi:hypothetical protein